MSTLELRKKINQLNHIDLDKADYRHLVSLLWSASKNVQIPVVPLSAELYFRARICNTRKINNVSELGAPPADLITGYQRCNPPGVSMFYASSKRITALLECDAKEGDIVYLGQWMSTIHASLNRVLSHPDEALYNNNLSETDILFHSYLETLFTRPIHRTYTNAYKITAAATEVLTTNFPKNATFPNSTSKSISLFIDGTAGLSYPSVANISNSYNTVFHASFTKTNFKLIHVVQLRVIKKTDKEYSIEIIDTANETIDGNILWLNSCHSIPRQAISREGVEFYSNGRNWIIPVRDTPLTAEDIDFFLNE